MRLSLRRAALPAVLLALPLLQCGSGSDPLISQGPQFEGPFYFVGTITTMTAIVDPVPQTTSVPMCSGKQISGFYPAGTVIPFQASLLSGGLIPDQSGTPPRIRLQIRATDTARNTAIEILTDPSFDQEAIGLNSGPLIPPLSIVPDPALRLPGVGTTVNLDLLCAVVNQVNGQAMAFTSDRFQGSGPYFNTSDELQIHEVTTAPDANGDIQIAMGHPIAGCIHAIVENTYPNPGGGGDQNSRLCVNACYRIPARVPVLAVPNIDTSVSSCPAGSGCAACIP